MNYLKTIGEKKRGYVERLKASLQGQKEHPLNIILNEGREKSSNCFSSALKGNGLQVIAEIKRASPSKGKIRDIKDSPARALQYCHAGASAISVLTDTEDFGGSLEDLTQVSDALKAHNLNAATMRKDFILHPLQIAEAVLAGSDAILLIVALVGSELKTLLNEVKRLGLEALVEVHDEGELDRALASEAEIIGVNHRNLKTLEMDLLLSERLIPKIPASAVRVAESGIHTPEQARYMRALGFDAILVGEALSRSDSPESLIEQMRVEL